MALKTPTYTLCSSMAVPGGYKNAIDGPYGYMCPWTGFHTDGERFQHKRGSQVDSKDSIARTGMCRVNGLFSWGHTVYHVRMDKPS